MEQPEHLDWDGVHGEALRTALQQLPGVFDAALLPKVVAPIASCYKCCLKFMCAAACLSLHTYR